MNKKLIPVMLSLVLMSTFAMPTFAVSPPQFGSEIITQINYKVYDITEHKWEGAFNSNLYTVNIYNFGNRLLGWQILMNRNAVISERNFISSSTNLPLCSDKTVSYIDYKGQTIQLNSWNCLYDNSYYKINIYSKGSLLLGWQIFKNGQLVSFKSFV